MYNVHDQSSEILGDCLALWYRVWLCEMFYFPSNQHVLIVVQYWALIQCQAKNSNRSGNGREWWRVALPYIVPYYLQWKGWIQDQWLVPLMTVVNVDPDSDAGESSECGTCNCWSHLVSGSSESLHSSSSVSNSSSVGFFVGWVIVDFNPPFPSNYRQWHRQCAWRCEKHGRCRDSNLFTTC